MKRPGIMVMPAHKPGTEEVDTADPWVSLAWLVTFSLKTGRFPAVWELRVLGHFVERSQPHRVF